MRRALEATNTTALLVTHDQDEALSLADQVAVMRAGRLVQSAHARARSTSPPTDPQVAEFVGRAVVLPGTATRRPAPTCALGEVVLTEPTTGPVALMIRPEQVFVDLAPTTGVRGTVEEVSYYGHDAPCRSRLDDGDLGPRADGRACATPAPATPSTCASPAWSGPTTRRARR